MSKIRDEVDEYFQSLPGKRGIDIPEAEYDKIFHIANGITRPIWGRPPTPEHLQALYEGGAHEPDSIHQLYDQMSHPHAPSTQVGEYDSWKSAYRTWTKHAK